MTLGARLPGKFGTFQACSPPSVRDKDLGSKEMAGMSIKPFVFAIVIVPAATWIASAQTLAPASPAADSGNDRVPGSSGPRIQFQSAEFDFGKLNQGEVVKHEFVFTNTGTATLEIKEVKPGCGCTTAGSWDKLVEPGKTGIIPLQFNSANFGGKISKSATATCNDPNRSNVVLQITGTVWKALEITPTMAIFNYSNEGQKPDTKVVRIVNNGDEPLTLSEPQCTNQSFRVELKSVQPGKEFELHITAVPPFATRSTIATVTLKTSSPKNPMLSVTAYVLVQPEVGVTPEQLLLPAGPLATTFSPAITIRAGGTNLLALSEPAVSVPGATVQLHQLQPGRLFNLVVSFPVGFQMAAGQKGEVTVKSNHPQFPLIKVPIAQPQVPATPAARAGVSPAPIQVTPSSPSGVRIVPSRSGSTTAVGK
jgi:hypothetical protein